MEGFWSWAKERFIKHHGVSKKRSGATLNF
jgi:hypothetical protein